MLKSAKHNTLMKTATTFSKNTITYVLLIMFFSFFLSVYPAIAATCCGCTNPNASDPKAIICIQTNLSDCPSLKTDKDSSEDVKKLNCTDPPLTPAQCQKIPQGVCASGPSSQITYFIPSDIPATKPVPPTVETKPPTLGIKIPGLVFTSKIPAVGGSMTIPWLAQYISAMQKYLIGISMTAAAIMLVYGGFLYILGTTGMQISSGKAIMIDAVIGLVLVLGAYTILATINPATIQPQMITLQIITPDYSQPMSAGRDAIQTLKEAGITKRQTVAGVTIGPTNLKIPTDCPGRSKSYKEPEGQRFATFGKQTLPKSNYALECKGRVLDQKTINYYLKFQEETGIPASVTMAQMVFEAGICSVFALADGNPQGIYFNFGGHGCTDKQVPAGSCAHVAFGPLAYVQPKKTPHPVDCTVFNKGRANCVNICQTQSRNTFKNCGDKCYPQLSTAQSIVHGKEVIIPSVQCSRKYNSPKEFLNAQVGFARFCLPYNDSAYKFAYCIGASTFFGTGSMATALATVIERNCLCDPSTDSLGCVRNMELEKKLANYTFRKANLAKAVDIKFQPDYDKVVNTLLETTKGLLNLQGARDTSDDINPRE